jgi:basic membrane protein A
MHRFRTALLIGLMALAACLLVACGEEKQEEKQAQPAKDQLQIGFIYVSPIGDAGWSYAHHKANLKLKELPWIKTSYVEAVPEGADSERVLRNMARKGYDVVFATSFGYMDPVMKVAKQFPDTIFEHCSGFKRAENVGTYFGRIYQARYLTGLVAGAMTDSDTIGYVAAFPIPEVIRGINAFTLGVRKVNPEAEVRVVWTKTWYDPALEKDAAESLLDADCDVIAQHQDSPGPQEAAQEQGVYSVGYNSDMSQFAPKAHLTAAVWDWYPLYKHLLDQVHEGTWESEDLWWGMDKGVVKLAPYGPMVPEKVRKMVDAEREKIMAGKNIVFQGPIKNQQGEQVVAEGEKLDDSALLGMTYFVQGVVGTAK